MAKETKQDRIVRGIVDQVTEHLHELKVRRFLGIGMPSRSESRARKF